MSTTTTESNTPGGTAADLSLNPHSSEAGPMDSGVGQSLFNPFGRCSKVQRSPKSATENFFQYENENTQLREQLREIKEFTAKLKEEFAILKKENEELRKAVQTPTALETTRKPIINDISDPFHTDEEELERETNWVLNRNKRPSKKRKAQHSPEMAVNLPSTSKEVSSQIIIKKQQVPEQQPAKPKEKAPPPISIVGISNFSIIQSIMKSVTTGEYKLVSLNNGVWKINVADSNTYRALATKLNSEGHQWFTYEDKNNRQIKVMARGLHPTCAKEEIIEDLKQKGHQIEDAVNIIKKEKIETKQGVEINKRGLPLFMLTFNNKEKVEDVYNIKAILNMRVKIEPLKKNSGLIPQCKKCQGFNHTQKYCQREPRCVRCAGKHHAQACPISKDVPAKCINCMKPHPANYRGCEIAKELQRLRNISRKQNPAIPEKINQTITKEEPNPQASKKGEFKLYSQVAMSKPTISKSTEEDTTVLQKILRSIEALNIRLAKQEKCLEALSTRLDKQDSLNEMASILY